MSKLEEKLAASMKTARGRSVSPKVHPAKATDTKATRTAPATPAATARPQEVPASGETHCLHPRRVWPD